MPKYHRTSLYGRNGVIECLPPVYIVNYLVTHDEQVIRPKFPVQFVPSLTVCELRYWGVSCHIGPPEFVGPTGRSTEPVMINDISYCILVYCSGECHFNSYLHSMTKGCASFHKSHLMGEMKSYREIDGMPPLPFDWLYYQFVF